MSIADELLARAVGATVDTMIVKPVYDDHVNWPAIHELTHPEWNSLSSGEQAALLLAGEIADRSWLILTYGTVGTSIIALFAQIDRDSRLLFLAALEARVKELL